MRYIRRMAALWALALALIATLPAHAQGSSRSDEILILGNHAGEQSLRTLADGSTRVEFEYNDRGRGDHIIATWKLDAAGIPIEYRASGNDYMKAPVEESLQVAAGRASWHSRSQHGEAAAGAFYLPENSPPEFLGVLARALLQAPQHHLGLLPAGEASIERVGPYTRPGASAGAGALVQYRLSGLTLAPIPIWLRGDGATAAVIGGWEATLAPGIKELLAPLSEAQAQADNARSARLAQELAHQPHGALLIRNARLFDPRDLTVTPGTSVLIRGERIVRLGADAEVRAPAGSEVLDARGRFLMPGLWDNHQHFGDTTGALDIAAGVTSARDMANDTDKFPARVARFDAGTELGPRVWKAGIIDGTGPLAGPTRMRVATVAEALTDVDWYAEHGYGQIKIYSSVPPALVPAIADEAHARGLRVSGHVPAFMSARQFVAAGADEIQHLNFIVLNFLFDSVKETRNMNRFTAVAAHAREFTPDKPVVREFIAYLMRHHTVLDPTVGIFEGMFCGDPAAISPGLEELAARLPPQSKRELLSGALQIPPGQEAAYREALPAMLELLKGLYAAGVTIIPGTDSEGAGYALHHELELYVRAGIAPAEVLRMATLTSARVIAADGQRGVIAPGKLADLILVDGDPSVRIADIRKVDVVVKGGRIYDAARVEQALGITARRKS
jgi:imidazolonepropionase-like amidohydrolase